MRAANDKKKDRRYAEAEKVTYLSGDLANQGGDALIAAFQERQNGLIFFFGRRSHRPASLGFHLTLHELNTVIHLPSKNCEMAISDLLNRRVRAVAQDDEELYSDQSGSEQASDDLRSDESGSESGSDGSLDEDDEDDMVGSLFFG